MHLPNLFVLLLRGLVKDINGPTAGQLRPAISSWYSRRTVLSGYVAAFAVLAAELVDLLEVLVRELEGLKVGLASVCCTRRDFGVV